MEGEALIKHVMEIIYATRNVVRRWFPFAGSHQFRVRHRWNFDSAVAERVRARVNFTHGICNVMNYVERTALSGNWGGNHVSSSPTPRQRFTRRRTHNAMPLCIIHSSFPSIKLTTRNFSLNIDGEKNYESTKSIDVISKELMRGKLMH